MQEILIRRAIKFFGNISKMAKKLKISRASIYRYLEGKPIHPEVASRIEKESKGKIKFKELISWKVKYYTELDFLPCPLVKTPLNTIIFPENITRFLHKKDLPLSTYHAICVDENLHHIYGLEYIEAAKKRRKKWVFAWHISLEDLRNKKYEVRYLLKTFDVYERIAITNAFEKFIGKRQGRRTDLDELVDLTPQVQGIKTREFAAQYQQDPQPAGGGIFKPDWFYLLDEEPDFLATFITVDTAETDKTYNDATVFSFWGLYKIKNETAETDVLGLHWVNCVELHIEPKDLENELRHFYT